MANIHDPLYQVLLTTLKSYGVDDSELLQMIADETTVQQFKAEEMLIHIGQRPQRFYIIRSGLIRYYYATENGKVWNKIFFREGQFSGSLNALITDGPCRYNVEAIEATEVYALPLDLIERDVGLHQQMQQLKVSLTEEMFLRNEAREALLLTCNAEARYQWLLDNEAWLLARIPQYQLASYLGMDAVSLSRIKKKLSREQ
jgi:CRP-like cAMP-binding protein